MFRFSLLLFLPPLLVALALLYTTTPRETPFRGYTPPPVSVAPLPPSMVPAYRLEPHIPGTPAQGVPLQGTMLQIIR